MCANLKKRVMLEMMVMVVIMMIMRMMRNLKERGEEHMKKVEKDTLMWDVSIMCGI